MQTLTNFIARSFGFSRNYRKSQYESYIHQLKHGKKSRWTSSRLVRFWLCFELLWAGLWSEVFTTIFQQMGGLLHNFYHCPDSLVRPSNVTCVIQKPPAFFGVFEIIILPSQKMLCSCWLHCLCPGTCPASWGLRGKDLVFLQHGHMGITVTRPQKRLVFLAWIKHEPTIMPCLVI